MTNLKSWYESYFPISTLFLVLTNLKSWYESYFPLSTLFLVFLFNQRIRNWLYLMPLNTVVAAFVSKNGPSYFVLFFISLQSYNYGVTHFWLTYFILSIVSSNTISTYFVVIILKKVSSSYVLERKLFLRFDWLYFW